MTSPITRQPDEQRVLILAPFGRDAQLAEIILRQAGVSSCTAASIDALVDEIGKGAGVVMVAGESLNPASMKRLAETLSRQAPWSEIPIIVMVTESATRRGPHVFALALEELGNITFLPRPFSQQNFLGIVRFALRSRLRQYAMRDLHLQLDAKVAELARSNGEFEAFAYTAAHDMREPIRVIESYLGMVSERFASALGPAGVRYLGTAAAAAVRMRTLLEALLGYAHVGNDALVTAEVSLRSVAAAAVKNLSAAIAACDGEVIIEGDDHVIQGDGVLLTQLMQNLVGNALKFHRPGTAPRVHITWRAQPDGIRCMVSDNGIGIARADQERIFGIFQRLNGVSQYPGSGIGLATCRRIIDRHKGRIWVESTEDSGSTFNVFIPRREASHSHQHLHPAPAALAHHDQGS